MNEVIYNEENVLNLARISGLDFNDAENLYLLLNSVPNSYKPRENAAAIAIGTGNCFKEGSMIRALHKIKFNCLADVIGCDVLARPKTVKHSRTEGDYKYELRGKIQGDASLDDCWIAARDLLECNSFDYVHSFRPDFVDFERWERVYRNSVANLTPEGVAVIVSSDYGDIEKLDKISRLLRHGNDIFVSEIRRFVREETIGLEDDDVEVYGSIYLQRHDMQ